jgi:hypothetical protein
VSFQHRYVVGHVTREALVREGGSPRVVVVVAPLDRAVLATAIERHRDPNTAAVTFDGFPLVDHGDYVEVLIYAPNLLPRASAFAIEMHEHGCDVADVAHGRDPVDPHDEWREDLGDPDEDADD